MAVDRGKIIAFGFAFILGTMIFTSGLQVINPETDLVLYVAGIDTDLGATTYDQKGQLAEASWYSTPSTIRVDPDRAGNTNFMLRTSGIIHKTINLEVSNSKCGQPDIIVTITEPQEVLVQDPEDFTTPAGEPFKLYKTIFWVTIKTSADAHADTVVAEIAQSPQFSYANLGYDIVDPPVGEDWEGNVFVEYGVRHHPEAFIYEVYIDEDPLSDFTRKDLRGTDPNLYASDVPAVAYPYIESQKAVAFYDAIEGNEIKDFEAVRTTRGILPLGAKLGVGANVIFEESWRGLKKEFKGWNILNVYVQYQVAVRVAVPLADTVDEDGNPKEDVLSGSRHEEEAGQPQEFRPEVKDREFDWPDFPFPEIPKWLKFMFWGLVVVIIIGVSLKVILWVMPRRR